MRTVHILGAGIAGLTCAHEVLDNSPPSTRVVVYEKEDYPGGFACSSKNEEGDLSFPTEHSWRGYAPFYRNLFEMVDRVSSFDRSRMFSKPLRFFQPRDSGEPSTKGTRADTATVVYYALKAMCASPERECEYARIDFREVMQRKLSENGYLQVAEMLGPGLGLDMYRTSLYHVGKYATGVAEERSLEGRRFREGWSVMMGPTNEVWIDPWVQHLKQTYPSRFELRTGTIAHRLRFSETQDRVLSFAVADTHGGGDVVFLGETDTVVVATDPFTARDLFREAGLSNQDTDLLKGLIREGPHSQVAFRVVFSEPIEFPEEMSVFALPDSEYNITVCPQKRIWGDSHTLDPRIGALWSGTACQVTERPGALFGVPGLSLTREDFAKEIYYQIRKCIGLDRVVRTCNKGRSLDTFEILGIEVWKAWQNTHDGLEAPGERKWVTTMGTLPYRPPQRVQGVSNLVMSGAHTRTSMSLWSMEGAVEAGKLSARVVCKAGGGIPVHTHRPPALIRAASRADSVLYGLGLPNVLDVALALTAAVVGIALVAVWSRLS